MFLYKYDLKNREKKQILLSRARAFFRMLLYKNRLICYFSNHILVYTLDLQYEKEVEIPICNKIHFSENNIYI